MCMYVLTQWCSLSGSVPRWCSSGLTSSAASGRRNLPSETRLELSESVSRCDSEVAIFAALRAIDLLALAAALICAGGYQVVTMWLESTAEGLWLHPARPGWTRAVVTAPQHAQPAIVYGISTCFASGVGLAFPPLLVQLSLSPSLSRCHAPRSS
jgi:hypothetical protein